MEREVAYNNQGILCHKNPASKCSFYGPFFPHQEYPCQSADGVQVPLVSLEVTMSPTSPRLKPLLALCDLHSRKLLECVLRG